MKNLGISWGPFKTRLPHIHMRIEWSLLIQGLVISVSTGLALVPLLTASFGLSFEEAVALAMLHMMLVTSHIIVFGEPYAAGWITPALPLVLAFVLGGYDTPAERFQMMTALSLDFAVLTFLLSITGLGRGLGEIIPAFLKGGIILGAGLSSFKRIFYDDVENFRLMPVTYSLAIITCVIVFYLPAFQKWKVKNKFAATLASYGLLPTFIIAGLFGTLNNELHFDIQSGFLIPPLGDLFNKISPFAIGFPPLEYFVAGIPIALIAYLILFGDLITGKAMIEDNQKYRPDDPVDSDLGRAHFAVSIRNFLMAIFAPFFPTQGVLWAGAQVLVIERWKEGREKLDSLIGGISAFYYYGIPIMFFILPVLTFLRPFLPLSLMLTLLLTGIACSKLSLSLTKSLIDRTMMVIIALLLTFYDPWVGLLVGAVFYVISYYKKANKVN